MKKVLVLGLGNPFRGDDGLGAAVIAVIKEKEPPANVVVLDGGTPGLETILIWEGYKRVIIVDAAEMGLDPGQWKRFVAKEVILPLDEGSMRGTLHNAGLADALALADALGMLPQELVFYCVQPAFTGWSPDLTPQVTSSIPSLCAAISNEIEEYAIDAKAQALR